MSEQGKKLDEFDNESLRTIAKEIIEKRLALKIHLWAYILVNILLFIINYFTTNHLENGARDMWVLHSVAGWGIGLAIHILTYIIFKKGIVDSGIKGFIFHFVIYIIVAIYLVFIDYIVDNSFGWYFWAIGPWGLGVLAHFIYIYKIRKINIDTKTWMDKKIDEELNKINKKE